MAGLRCERWLTGAMIAVAFVAPLLIGGALPWAQVGLSAACLAIVICTFLALPEARHLKLSPLTGMLLFGVGVTAFQLVPLPVSLVNFFSSHTVTLRADAQAAPLRYLPITLDVSATALALVRALAVAGLFVAVASITHRRRRALALLWGVALTGAVLAVIAVVERAVSADAILGIYQPAWCRGAVCRDFVGTFVNRNHAAEMFGLSMCVAIGLAAQGGRWRGVAIAVALLAAIGLGLAGSRGGVVAFSVAVAVLLILVLSRNFGRVVGIILTLLIIALGIAVVVMLTEGTSARFEEIDLHYLANNQIVRAWRDSLGLLRDFFWLGVGRGAFLAPFQRYHSVDDGATITHPENILLQFTSEWGIPLTLVFLTLGGVTLWRHRQSMRKLGPVEWGAALGIAGVLLQNMVDFGLEIMGIALPVAVTLGALVGRSCAKESVHRRRIGSIALVVVMVGWLGALGLAAREVPHSLVEDDARLRAMVVQGVAAAEIDRAAAPAIKRHPSDYHLELVVAMAHVNARDAAALHHLNRVLRLRPRDVEAHRWAGLTLARRGRISQAALEYRTAFEGGMPLVPDYLAEIVTSLREQAINAVPLQLEPLMALARVAAANNKPVLAEEACIRAQEITPDNDQPSRLGLTLALAAKDNPRSLRATEALEKNAHSATAMIEAARGFHQLGQLATEERIFLQASKMFPEDAAVGLALAQHYYDAGDFTQSRRAIERLIQATGDLDTRRQAEEMLAVIETRAGDEAQAIMARARARMYRDTLRSQRTLAP